MLFVHYDARASGANSVPAARFRNTQQRDQKQIRGFYIKTLMSNNADKLLFILRTCIEFISFLVTSFLFLTTDGRVVYLQQTPDHSSVVFRIKLSASLGLEV